MILLYANRYSKSCYALCSYQTILLCSSQAEHATFKKTMDLPKIPVKGKKPEKEEEGSKFRR